jgi:hypothetical protein
MVLLTGLLGTVLGFVLIGGALVAAFLIGRARGRRDALESASGDAQGSAAQLLDLERRQRALREEMQLLASRLPPGASVNSPSKPAVANRAE